jgi:predicted dehydrogenase
MTHRLATGMKAFANATNSPSREGFSKILEDHSIDALFIAAPNHWHAPAAILACSAGKHVYVEKPGSHNAREGELLVQAARKNKRVVQMGNQRRSSPAIQEGFKSCAKA